MRWIYISLFGVLGVLLRYGVNVFVREQPFPQSYGTFAINVVGSFIIGMIYVLSTERHFLSRDLSIGLMVGLMGGFTTFSAYALETMWALESSQVKAGISYFVLSPLFSLTAVWAGMNLTRVLTNR